MNYLGHPQAELEAAGGIWTAREIAQQPAVWTKIERMMTSEAGALRAFLDPLLRAAGLAHRVDRRRHLGFCRRVSRAGSEAPHGPSRGRRGDH